MISRDAISAAYERVRPHIRRTPVLQIEPGALGLDIGLTLKLEHVQQTGSFKVRGAFNNLLSKAPPQAGVVAISGGNHGAAVAYAATKLGAKSVVFVPTLIANDIKIARMQSFGAEVIVAPGTVDDAIKAYQDYANQSGALAIHPYDAVGTITGQGTVGLEFEDQVPDLDTLFVSVGGGGLIGGVALWYAGRCKIVAVETEGTNSLDRILNGTLPIEIIRAHVAENIVVTDEDVVEAQRRLWAAARLVGEPGGVIALAALTSGAYRPASDERVGVLICGGNAAPDWFQTERA